MMNNKIRYFKNKKLNPKDVAQLFIRAGLKRPSDDVKRIGKMLKNADLVITAWEGKKLVGIARSLTDFTYCTYLSDLAVDKDFQKQGIGRELVNRTQKAIGEKSMLLLLSVPTAVEYYPKIGFQKNDFAFLIQRKR